MSELPSELVEEITRRISDPKLRHGVDYWIEVSALVPAEQVGCRIANSSLIPRFEFDRIVEYKKWAQRLRPKSQSPSEPAYPLALPATETEIAAVEVVVGRKLPEELRQLFQIANGGWGPGDCITPGHGRGILSTKGAIDEWHELRRYLPEVYGALQWPEWFLPISDVCGTIAYDLESGKIVLFNEHFDEQGLAPEEAFPVVSPDLATLIDDWLCDHQ